MLFRVELKVYVMKESHYAPVFSFISKSQFVCIPFHDSFHSQGMLDVERILVVFLKNIKCFVA